MNILHLLRKHRQITALSMLAAVTSWSTLGYAETLYKADGANTLLNVPMTVGSNTIANMAENAAPTAADVIAFNNFILAARTFRIANTNGTNVSVLGLQVVNPGGAITLQNQDNQSQTLTIGTGGIDMSRATQNLTISNATGGTVTVAMGAAQNWAVAAGRTLRVDSVISGSSGMTVTPSAYNQLGGTVELRGANTFTGATSVTGSTLLLDYGTAANRIAAGSGLTLNRATLTVQGGATHSQAVTGLTLGTGANQITFGGTTASINVGAITRSGFDSLLNVGTASRATTSTANTTGGILGGWAVLNKSDWAVGGGAITALATYQTGTDATTWGAAENVSVNAATTVNPGDQTINSLRFGGAFNLTQNAGTTLNIATGGILKNSNTATTISGGNITAGGVADGLADTLYIWQNQNTMAVSSVFNDNGSDVVNLVKAGDATLRLDNATSHGMTGTVTITGGRILIGNGNTAGTLPGSNVVFAISPGSAAATAADDGMLVYNRTDSAAWTQNLTGVGGDDAARYALRKSAGAATILTLTPASANTYYGGTRIQAGTIAAGNATALSPNSKFQLDNTAGVSLDLAGFSNTIRGLTGGGTTGGNVTLGSGTLTLAPLLIDNLTFAGVISGDGGLVKTGEGTQVLSANQTYTGATSVTGGALTVGALTTSALSITGSGSSLSLSGNSSAGTLTSAANTTLTLGTTSAAASLTLGDGGTTVAGVIREASSAFPGSMIKNGGATLTLAGGNAYTGATTVNGGAVILDNTIPLLQKIPDRSAVTLATGTSLNLNGVSETVGSLEGTGGITRGTAALTVGLNNASTTYGGVIDGAGAFTKIGTGTLTLTNNQTMTGPVTVTYGGLTLAASSPETLVSNVVRLGGRGSALNVNVNENIATLTGGAGTTINIGAGATLTTGSSISGTNITPSGASTTVGSTFVSFATNHNLTEGMLISGTAYQAGTFVRRVISPTQIELSAPANATAAPATTASPVGIISATITGDGGLTKDGPGRLWLQSPATNNGPTTLSAGTLILGGERTYNQILSRTSDLITSPGTTLTWFSPAATVRQYQEVASLSGTGGDIDLFGNSASRTVLVAGRDNSDTTWGGVLLGNNAETGFIKTGTGNMTFTAAQTYDGLFRVEQGTATLSGAARLDDAAFIVMGNQTGATLNYNIAANQTDAVQYISGGGRVVGFRPYSLGDGVPSGANLGGNYIGQTGGDIAIAATTTLQQNTGNSPRVFGGVLSGAGTFRKSGTGLLDLWGANTISNVTIDAGGTLRMGAFGSATGLGVPTTGGTGALIGTSVTMSGGVLDLNGGTITVNKVATASGTNTLAIGNGTLNINTISGTTGVFAGSLTGGGTVNVNATLGASGWDFTGTNSFTGTMNINGGVVQMNRAGGETFADAMAISVAAPGTLRVITSDTISSLNGGGTVDISTGAILQLAQGNNGSFSGSLTGAGDFALLDGGLRMSGDNTLAGGILFRNSTVTLDYSSGATDIIPAALTLEGAMLYLKGNSTAETLGGVTLARGNNVIVPVELDTSRISLGAITRNDGGALFVADGGASTSTANLVVGAGKDYLGGFAVQGAAFLPETWAVANGAGTAISGLGAAAFTNNSWAANTHTDVTGSFNASGTTESVRFNTAGAHVITLQTTLGDPQSFVNTGGILLTSRVGNNQVVIRDDSATPFSQETLSGGGANGELFIHQYNPQNSLLLDVQITGGLTPLTKTGQGTLILARDNNYGGITTIGQGEIRVGTGGAAGTLGSNAVVNNGVLTINRSDAAILGSQISGTGMVRQMGAGSTTILGSNSYTGRTSVLSGTLVVENDAALGAVSGLTSVESGAVLRLTPVQTAISTGETILLKGGTISDSTTNLGFSQLGGPLVLLGGTNTIQVATADDVLRITGGILGAADTSTSAGSQPANLVVTGLGTLRLESAGAYTGTTTINAGATLQLGDNTNSGNVGPGAIINNGTLTLDRSTTQFFLNNNISGSGTTLLNRNTAWLGGELSGFTGTMQVGEAGNPTPGKPNVQLYLGNHDILANPNLGFDIVVNGTANIPVVDGGANNEGGSSGVRLSFGNPVTNLTGDVTLISANEASAANNRLTYFVKNNLGTVNLTGRLAGTFGGEGVSTDDRAYLEINGGVLRIVGNTAAGTGLMGVSAGVADPGSAFDGQIVMNSFNTLHWGYLILDGDRDTTITAGITGGGNQDQGGIFVHNSTGTTILNPPAVARGSLGAGNTFFNSRNQINRGTVVLQNGAAWRDDAPVSIAPGATLQIDANESIGATGLMKGGTLTLNANVVNSVSNDVFMAGLIDGSGELIMHESNRTRRIYGTTNSYSGITTIRNGNLQISSIANAGSNSSLGTGSSVVINTLTQNGANTALLQFVGLGTATQTTDRDLTITGTGTGNTTITRGIASYGAGAIDWQGLVSIAVGAYPLYLRGSRTPATPLMAPFDSWSADADTVSGAISGPGGIVKEDGGVWAITNPGNTFAGGVTINNGRLVVPDLGALGTGTKTIGIGSGTNTPHLEFSPDFAGGTLASTMNMNLTGTTGTVRIVNLGTGALTIADPTWEASGAGSKTLAIGRFDDTTGFVNAIDGVIVNNSATNTTGLAKDGLSTWRLNGVNTFTGAVTVNEGVLQLGNAGGNTLAANVSVTVANQFGRGSTLELLSNESIGGFTMAIGGTVNLNGFTLTVGENNPSTTNNGVISGSGGLTKTGTGVLTNGAASSQVGLTSLGQNTYTGPTIVSGGRIDTATFADGGAASGFGQSSNAAANLRLNGANNVSDIGIRYLGTSPASTDRLFQISPSDTATRTNNGIWASPNVVLGINEDAIVNFTNTGAIGFTGAAAATLTLRGNEGSALLDHTFSPQIVDNGANVTHLQKAEAGNWVVTNANTYTGTTTVAGGTLVITNATALGATTGGTTLSAGGAGLELRNNITVTGETATVTGDGGFIGSGAGSNVWAGNLAANQNTRVYAELGATFELTGNLTSDTNARTLSFLDSGTVIFSGSNTGFQGPTTVAGDGVFRLNYATNSTSKLADGVALTLGGTGLLTLSGNDYSNHLVTRQVWPTGGTLELAGGSHLEVVSATTINSGASKIVQSAGTSTLRMNAITRNAGGALDVNAANVVNTDTFQINSANPVLHGWATINRADWATSANTGTDINVAALAPGGYTAGVFNPNTNTDVAASFTAAANTTGTIRFNTGGNSTVTLAAGTTVIETGGILATSAATGNNVITGATLRPGSTELIVHQHGAGTLTLDTVIAGTTSLYTAAPTGNTTNANATIANLASTAGLQIGAVVSGPGIPANARVIAITANSVTLDQNATATATGVALTINNSISAVTATRTNASNQVTGLASTAGLQVGMTVSGNGIPANAVITRINDATAITISANATATGSTTLGFSAPVQYQNGGLTKTGTGALILTQDNTFLGQINALEGVLQVGNGGTTGTLGAGTGTSNPVVFGRGATLLMNTTKTAEYNFGALSGEGNLTLASTNTQPLLLDDDNNNFIGVITINGGTLRARGSANALGNVRGEVIVNNGGALELAGASQTFANLITYNQGAVLRSADAIVGTTATNSTATLSGQQFFNNSLPSGLIINTSASTTIPGSTNSLTISGIIIGNNGFTKTGNGTLTLSGQNFFDGVPTLNGQVVVAGGVLNLGNGRALGGVGAGNETIVQSGASLDLRGTGLNFGDDTTATREIVQIAGTGYLGTGALRNTTGTGVVSILNLAADASVGGNSTVDLQAFDTNLTPGITITRPVINGGGYSLTKVGTNDFRLFETDVLNLNKFIISEGEARSETRAQFPFAANAFTTNPLGVAGLPTPVASYPHTLLLAGNINGGVEIVYNGPSFDPVNGVHPLPNVGARLDLFRQHGAHHTANISAFGRSAGSGGTIHTNSYLELNSDTLPKVYTYWDGNISLTGLANGSNTYFNIEGGGAGTLVGNAILGNQAPGGDQVVNPQSILFVRGQIMGAGGITKIGSRELRLTSNNTFTGDFVTNRINGVNQPVDPNQANEARSEWWNVTLSGQGRLSGTQNVILERNGLIRVDNTTALDSAAGVGGAATNDLGANLPDRINNSAAIRMRAGYLIFDSGTTAVTETLGTIDASAGTSYIAVNGTNGANVNTSITLGAIQRASGSTLNLIGWDSTSTFSTAAPGGADSLRYALGSTSGLAFSGAGTGTARNVAVGVFGGLAVLPHDDPYIWANAQHAVQMRNLFFFAGRDMMTLDGGYLRPLDDSEYYTDAANIMGAAGQNLNLNENYYRLDQSLAVNSLRLGNLSDNLGNNSTVVGGSRMTELQDTTINLHMDDCAVLQVTSGMILSAAFGHGVNQTMETYIRGGIIDFGSSEGIIKNVNGFYRTADGVIVGNNFIISSAITGDVGAGNIGLTKTGTQQVVLDGANSYSGLTVVSEGNLLLRNGQALGAGGAGNGVRIVGSGGMSIGSGVNIGSVIGNPNLNAAREDIRVGIVSGDQTILASADSLNRHYGSITVDNVDNGGQVIFRPRLTVAGSSGLVLAGDIGGGDTPISNDTYYINPRHLSMEGSGNGYFLMQGTFGDKIDSNGNAVSLSGPIANVATGTVFTATSTVATSASTSVQVTNPGSFYVGMPISGSGVSAGTIVTAINTASGTLTLSNAATIPAGSALSSPSFVNENEAFTFMIGFNDELNVMAYNPSKQVGRMELMRGYLRYVGTGDYYDPATLALVNASQAGSAFAGLQIGGSQYNNSPGNDSMAAFMLTRPGQSLGVNNWTITTHANNNNGAVMIGGENESGTVRFGPTSVATPSTIALGRDVRLYANAGGTVDINSRFTGGSISKIGRGTVNIFGSSVGDGSAANLLVAGGELNFDYTLANNLRMATNSTSNFNGGTLRFITNAAANSTQGISNTNGNNINIRPGGTEIIAQAAAGRTMAVNFGRLASATDGALVNRTDGGTVNFVEFANGGTAAITLAARSGIVSNAALPWATYGTGIRQAQDFAMVEAVGNNVNPFNRALDEFRNDASTWLVGMDVSENGGAGFFGTPGAGVAVNTVRFDANAESVLNLGANTQVVGSGGILVSSNVAAANKTITGGTLTSNSSTSATTTASSAVLTGISSTAGMYPGMPVSGTNIPAGSFITAVNSSSSVTINQNVSGAGTQSLVFGSTEMMIHHYANGTLTIGSKIGAAGSTPTQVTVTGPSVTGASTLSNWIPGTTGQVVLTADNSTAGQELRWYVNGSVLSISNENQLGKVDIASATSDSVYLNGGALRWTGSGNYNLDQERGFTIGGNGGVIDVVNADAVLGVVGEIRTENNYNFINGSAANHQGGDLIKMGAGTLRLDGDYVPPTIAGGATSGSGNNASFGGLIDVREGTLRLTGNSTTAANGTVTTILGTSRSMHDGTILRAGASMEFAMGSSAVQNPGTAVPGHEWRFEEWFRFEGDNLINFGTPGGAEVASGTNVSLQNRLVRLDGVNEIAGNVTMEVEAGMTVRLNQSSGGYLTGAGSITKVGSGDLEFRENSTEWTGGLNILQGTVRTANAGRPLGMGTLPINLGSTEHQGIAQLAMHNEQAIYQQPNEIFQNINVIYNPAQAKRITFDNPQGLGQDYYIHGNITLSDNLGIYHNRGAIYTGGQFPFAYINGQLSDDTVNGRSGNIAIHHDDANSGTANNQQNSPGIGYVVLNNNNSAWTGDLIIGINQSWDQDEFIAVRLGHAQALTAANDVTMNGSSILQAGGNNITIGSLHTNNGSGTLAGTANDGLGGFEGTAGSSAYIENAAASPGTIAITQTTPVTTEALWDVHFRNGQLPSHFFNQSECVGAALSVSKLGNGWATMTLDNDYTGVTRVSAGILQVGKNGVGDTGAANAAGAIVESGGVIAGSGTIQGGLVVQSGGELRPGDVAGGAMSVLTVNGNMNLLGGSITTLQVGSATYNNPTYVGVGQPGYNTWINGIPTDSFSNELTSPALGAHDQVLVNGAITTEGTTKVVVTNNGYTPVAGDVFNLFDWFTSLGGLGLNTGALIRTGTETGTNLDLFELGGHYRWDTSLFNSHGILVVVPNVVPEPGRFLLLMLGLLAIFGRRRRS